MTNKKTAPASTFGLQYTSVVSVALTLVILGILAISAYAAHRMVDSVRSNVSVTVYAKNGATALELNRIKRLVKDEPAVSHYKFLSADMVLAQEVRYIGEDVAAILDENPYSAEFDLHLNPRYVNADSVDVLTRRLSADAAVKSVQTNTAVVQSVDRSFGKLALVLGCVAAILLVISFVLINNTVSLSIYSRRFVLRTMKLVGATPSFIRRPFVRTGISNGAIAGLLASAVLAAIQAYAMEADAEIAELLSWTASGCVYAALVVLGAIICAGASWFAATRYLRLNYDSLYRR